MQLLLMGLSERYSLQKLSAQIRDLKRYILGAVISVSEEIVA
jgi:hypothetical protein